MPQVQTVIITQDDFESISDGVPVEKEVSAGLTVRLIHEDYAEEVG